MVKIMILKWMITGWNPQHCNSTVCYNNGRKATVQNRYIHLSLNYPDCSKWKTYIYM
jgi:hypothetical protein